MTKAKAKEVTEALDFLRNHIRKGGTVYTALCGVNRSGTARWMDVYVIIRNRPIRITNAVCTALCIRYDRKREALYIYGGGMDMGFHVVYSLGRALFPKGGPISQSSRHHFGAQAPTRESDGGYLINHRWL